MEQLDLLRNLETHQGLLESYKKELAELENKLKVKELEQRVILAEKKLERLRFKREETSKFLKKCNNSLIEYNYKVKEVEKNLYNENTRDIRQLEYLSNENDNLKEIVSNKETEVIKLMDEIDIINKEILEIEEYLQKNKERIVKQKKKYKVIGKNLKDKIIEEKNQILSIEDSINKDLLEKYYNIRKNRGSAISIVKNGICNKCNMILPRILLDWLEKGEIVYCENCGRILCKQN